MHLHITLDLVGRIVAGVIGFLALYVGSFTFKGERDRWQNRLENVWNGIDRRARKTNPIFVALINRVSQGTFKVFNNIFGHETVSWKLVAVSVSSSFLSSSIYSLWGESEDIAKESNALFGLLFALCLVSAIRSRKKLIHMSCLMLAIARTIFAFYSIYLLKASSNDLGFKFMNYVAIFSALMVCVSCVINALAVAIIEKRFGELQNALTGARVFVGIVVLTIIAICTCTAVAGI
jgi:hypothetical protein